MSDPVSNAEIEDVLSSIRELISAGQTDKADGADAQGTADNKLILTPAFRVYDGDKAGAENKRAYDGRDIPVEKLGHEDLETDLQEVDQGKLIGELAETFGGNAELQSGPGTSVVSNDPPVDYEDNWDDDSVGETAQVAFLHQRLTRTEDEDLSEDTAVDLQEEQSLDASEDILEAEVADLDADIANTDAEIADTLEAQLIEAVEAELVEVPSETDDLEEVAEQENDLDAAVEAVIADTDNAFDEAEEDESSVELEAEGALNTETIAEETVTVLVPDSAPKAEIVDDDTDFIDEDHLQEIVSRIVRDELQGQMGVKITQAVRRMVRREVTRALSIEKFD
ncbi:hypothetical protein [Aliiroseovarius sp. F20344]|uniref:hypothetical protein n=1 Tax=Aliiroseovarius sp. F20344 TaxID=2926414 RepID=UPI001FF5E3F2|nr:hypothetical protein [Aliiroseovarius sp. F20344]MCK0143017.1 hypothetical protein [Aliiroseovarius sp. F20344]